MSNKRTPFLICALLVFIFNNILYSQSTIASLTTMDTLFVPQGVSSFTTCNAKIYDIGGPTASYPSGSNSTVTIYPADSCSLLQISGVCSIGINDRIYLYDGVGTNGTLLGTYYGAYNIAPITSLTGPITLKFIGNYISSGFNLTAMCVAGCIPPTIVSSIPEINAIHLTWSSCSSDTFDLKYSPKIDTNWTTISNISNNSISLTNLSYLTNYEIKIRSHCGTSYSGWRKFYVFTLTPNEISVPFIEDFSDTITCLTMSTPNKMYFALNNYSLDAPYLPIPTQNFVLQYNGSIYGTNTFGYFVTPIITNLTKGDEIRYRYYRNGQSSLPGSVQIFVNNTPSLSGAVMIQQIPLYTNSAPNVYGSGFYEYKAFVPEDTFNYVIFKTLSSSTEIHYIDNISILKGSFTCPSPTALALSDVNTNSLTLNWTEIGTASEWQIEYGPMGFQTGSGTLITNITAKPYNITGLPYGQLMGFRVRSILQPGDTSNWSSTKLCIPGWVFTKSGINSISSCQLRYFDNGGPYSNYSPNSSGTLIVSPSNPNAKLAITGSYTLGFQASLEIYKGTSATGTNLLSTINNSNPIISNNGSFTIKFTGGYFTNTGYEFNLFCVDSSCWAPVNINVQNITHEQAFFNWTHYNLIKPVEIAYKPVADSIWSLVSTSDTSTSIVINGLLPNTNYQYKIRSVCAPGDTSLYSSTQYFKTDCPAETTFFEDFESTPVDSIPSCWNKFYSYCNYKVIAPNNYTSSKCLQITSHTYDGIILPKISNLGNGTHQLRLTMRPNSDLNYDHALNFGYMTNLNDINSFVSFQVVTLSSHDFNEYIVVPPTGINANYIVIRGLIPGLQYIFIDEITWEEIPTCTTPVSFVSNSVTDQTCDLKWNSYQNSNLIAWEVQYAPSGFTPGNGISQIVNVDSCTISGLSPHTDYDFYVRAICSSTDTSDWSNKISLETYCSDIQLPVEEGFEFDFMNSSCWTLGQNNQFDNTGFLVDTIGTQPNCTPQSGLNMLGFNTFNISSGAYALLISPRIECNGSKIHITYYQYRDNGYTSSQFIGEGVALFYNSTPSLVGADSVGFVPRQNSVNGWYLIDYLIPEGVVGVKYFIFKAISKYGNNQYLDNFHIEFLCPTPSNLTVSNVLTTEASLSWQSNLSNNAFILDYKKSNDTNWTSILNITGNNFILSNLQQNQTYYARLRALCDTAGMSANTNMVTFTTLVECLPPTFIQIPDSFITDSTATVFWNHAPFFNLYEVSYKLVADVDWILDTTDHNFYVIHNLIPNQQYQVRTKTICSVLNSTQTPNVYFSTKCYFPESFSVVEQSITATSARLEWHRIANETEWVLNYKKEIDQNWLPVTIQDTFYQFNNLEPNTTYLARIQSLCGTNGSVFSNPVSFTTLVLGMDQNVLSGYISVLPNPTNDYIEIMCKREFCEISRIEIVNSIGETLYAEESSNSQLKVDLSSFTSGLFFIKIQTNLGLWSTKIVKL